MAEVSTTELAKHVEHMFGGTATLTGTRRVVERFQGETVWDGMVHVFDLSDHPEASVCYAWSAAIEKSDRRKFYAVLGTPPVNSPETAVRAAIVNDCKIQGSKNG